MRQKFCNNLVCVSLQLINYVIEAVQAVAGCIDTLCIALLYVSDLKAAQMNIQ